MRETIFIQGAPGAGFPTIARMPIIDGGTSGRRGGKGAPAMASVI